MSVALIQVSLFYLLFISAEAAGTTCDVNGHGPNWTCIRHAVEIDSNGDPWCDMRCDSCTLYVTLRKHAGGGHSHSWSWETTSYPTCTTAGSKRQKCSGCGATQNTTSISALGHDMQSISSATCTSSSTERCSRCSYETHNNGALGHNWGSTQISKAGCTYNGNYYHVCQRCSTSENTGTIYASGHSDWTTCTTITYSGSMRGVKEYHCENTVTTTHNTCGGTITHRKYKFIVSVRCETSPDSFTAWENRYSPDENSEDASLYFEVGDLVRVNLPSGELISVYVYSTIDTDSAVVTTIPREFTVTAVPRHVYVTYWRKRFTINYEKGLN